jgi:hypothetical protein
MSFFCPGNPLRFGGHYFTKVSGKWRCKWCHEVRNKLGK